MRELVAGAIALSILLYISVKRDNTRSRSIETFTVEVMQNVMNQIKTTEPDIYPIDTVYFHDTGNGSYTGRFMFFNTKDYSGVQYDVQTKGSDIVSISKSIPYNYQNPFSGYSKFSDFKMGGGGGGVTIASSSIDMTKIWENYRAG
jgi:hypothetical protein